MAFVSTRSYDYGNPIMLNWVLGGRGFTGQMSGMGDLGDVISGVSGLGAAPTPVTLPGQFSAVNGYNGPIQTPSGVQNVTLSNSDLEAALAFVWGVPVTQANTPGFAGSGYAQNVLQMILSGQLIYNPASGSWSKNYSNPVAPSAAAAAAVATAGAASPFVTSPSSPAYTGSPVYQGIPPPNPIGVQGTNPMAPQLSFVTSRNGYALVPGDTWTITISGAQPNAPVVVTGGQNNVSATTPMGSTDGNGNFSLSGRISSDQVGVWAESWTVGGQAVGSFAFTVSNPTPSSSPVTPQPVPTGAVSYPPCGDPSNPTACGGVAPPPGSFFQQSVSIGGFQVPVWGFIVAAGGAALLLLGEKS